MSSKGSPASRSPSPAPSFVFLPARAVATLPSEELRASATELVLRVQEFHVPFIEKALNDALQAEIELIPERLRGCIEMSLKEDLSFRRYFDIVRGVVDAKTDSPRYVFEPELSLDAICDSQQRAEAEQVVAQVCETQVPLIEQAVHAAFLEDLQRVPAYLRVGLEVAMRQKFLLDQYIPIVRSIVSQVVKTPTHEECFAGHVHELGQWLADNGDEYPKRDERELGLSNASREAVLAQFVNKQRTAQKNGTLSKDRSDLLRKLPSWSYSPKADRWKEMYDTARGWMQTELTDVRESAKRRCVPNPFQYPSKSSPDLVDREIGQWLCNQRKEVVSSLRMPAQKKAMLLSLPGFPHFVEQGKASKHSSQSKANVTCKESAAEDYKRRGLQFRCGGFKGLCPGHAKMYSRLPLVPNSELWGKCCRAHSQPADMGALVRTCVCIACLESACERCLLWPVIVSDTPAKDSESSCKKRRAGGNLIETACREERQQQEAARRDKEKQLQEAVRKILSEVDMKTLTGTHFFVKLSVLLPWLTTTAEGYVLPSPWKTLAEKIFFKELNRSPSPSEHQCADGLHDAGSSSSTSGHS